MRRGYTLIELMVALAMLGIGVNVWMNASAQRSRAVDRAIAVEGIARVIDQELERMHACETARCLRGLATKTATSADLSLDAASWVRARVRRSLEPGPGPGLYRVTVTASVPGRVRERSATALVWVRP